MLQRDYLYISPESSRNTERLIIVLPEIFGVNTFVKQTTDRLAKEFKAVAVALDHFYAASGKVETFDYIADRDAAHAMIGKMSGDVFFKLFQTTLDELTAEYPGVTEIILVGFCFGGRLAYVAGTDQRVTKIISFYGAGPHTSEFFKKQTPIEALATARENDRDCKVISFYGAQDQSIPPDDRVHTRTRLAQAGINYTEKIYPTGHAYMNFERDNFHEASANASWQDIGTFLAA